MTSAIFLGGTAATEPYYRSLTDYFDSVLVVGNQCVFPLRSNDEHLNLDFRLVESISQIMSERKIDVVIPSTSDESYSTFRSLMIKKGAVDLASKIEVYESFGRLGIPSLMVGISDLNACDSYIVKTSFGSGSAGLQVVNGVEARRVLAGSTDKVVQRYLKNADLFSCTAWNSSHNSDDELLNVYVREYPVIGGGFVIQSEVGTQFLTDFESKACVEIMARLLNEFATNVLHVQFLQTLDGEIYPIDVMTRAPGDYLCKHFDDAYCDNFVRAWIGLQVNRVPEILHENRRILTDKDESPENSKAEYPSSGLIHGVELSRPLRKRSIVFW